MKKIFACLLLLTVSLLPIKALAYSANAYAVIEQSTGRVLNAFNANKRMTMASTTKVMTAIIVIENLDLDEEYDIPHEAVGISGSSIYLKKGERLTGRELLYGLMLASGNDAAYALAYLTSGTKEAFVDLMNKKAVLMGLENTRFSDPCGLASKNHYTTALELARICAYALNLPLFKEVVSTQNFKIRGADGTTRYLHNKNRILGEMQGGDGIKTGYTSAAGRCLCASATRGGMQLISVVLNDGNWFADSKALLEKAFSEYSMVQLAEKNKIVSFCNIFNGKSEKCDIIYRSSIYYPLKKDEKVLQKNDFVTAKEAPILKNETAGFVGFYLNGKEILKTECVYAQSVGRKNALFGG